MLRRCRYDARQKIKELSTQLSQYLNSCSILELDSIDCNEENIKNLLSGPSIIYVDGGNTFYLQKHILSSQFWKPIMNHLKDSNSIYIGVSAGAIVAGKSIKTAYWKGWDDPSVVGDDFQWNNERLNGLGIVDCSFFMHYNEEIYKNLINSHQNELNHPLITITDENALIYQLLSPNDPMATLITDYK